MSDKSRNKKNAVKGQSKKSGEKNVKDDPKNQRKPHHEKQIHKENKFDKKFDETSGKVEEPVDTVALFANLKRETDEILKITEGAKNKYSKREITSNWTKYELPPDNYDIVEDQEHGADFEELLHMPVSQGGHFQFKHEKKWTSDKKINDFKDLFSLNLNYISSALYCIPFYERNNLDPELFPKEQVERMANAAAKNMAKFKKNLPIERPESSVTKSLLDKLRETSDAQSTSIEKLSEEEDIMKSNDEIFENDSDEDDDLETMLVNSLTTSSLQENKEVDVNNAPAEEREHSVEGFTNQDLILESTETGLVFAKVPSMPAKSPEKVKKVCIDDDDELDSILGIKPSDIVKGKGETNAAQPTALLKTSNEKESITKPIPETKMDLDKWLDDYLES